MTGAPEGRNGERGLAATGLLVTAMLVGLAIFVFLATPYGLAVDAKARNRTAADAAALAGAEGAREALLNAFGHNEEHPVVPSWGGLPHPAGLGSSEAQTYAALNDGRVVEYVFDWHTGEAHVTVEGHHVDGQVSRSRAVARVDHLPCAGQAPTTPTPSWRPPPDPTPADEPEGEPTGAPSPSPSPPPVPEELPIEVLPAELACGPVHLRYDFTFEGDSLVDVTFPPGQDLEPLRDVMAVRLVD